MPRISEYARTSKSGRNVKIKETAKKEIKYDDIKNKYGKEIMSVAEWAVYLSNVKGLEACQLTEKTIKNYI